MALFDYVIFDFDGTVVDTGEGIFRSLQYAFEQMGDRVPDFSELRRFIGPPIHYSFTTFYGVSEERVDDYIKKYRERYSEKGIYESVVYEGMSELFDKLRQEGVKVGIASSKPQRFIHSVSEYLKISDKLDAVVGVKIDNSNHSTKTGLVLEAMKQLGATDKSRVLMVGDRFYDIDGAAGAGVKSCGVLWGYGSESEFREHNADFIVSAPEDIAKIVLS